MFAAASGIASGATVHFREHEENEPVSMADVVSDDSIINDKNMD